MPTEDDKIIDLPTDGPGAEVTLPEENVIPEVVVPEVKPEGEVEIKEIPAVEEKPSELITEKKEELKKGLQQPENKKTSKGLNVIQGAIDDLDLLNKCSR